MKSPRFCLLCLALTVVAVALGVRPLGAQGDAPALPKPGPEMARLKDMEGSWDATIKTSESPKESKGTMTCKLECNGMWLASSFHGDLGGFPFKGQGLDSYNPDKKKYVGVWVDSMSALPMLSEGSFDKEKQQLTMLSDYPGMDGKLTKYKMVTIFQNKDSHLWTLFNVDKEGKETQMMTIKYTRKK